MALDEPTPRALFGLMVAVFRSSSAVRPAPLPGWQRNATWFIFISMPPMPPPPKFDAPSSWHSNWNANSDECAHVARLGSVHRLEGCRRRRRRLTTFYGKWATYPPTYGMGYNRKYTCAYAPSTYDHINQYTSTYVLLFAYVRMCDMSRGRYML